MLNTNDYKEEIVRLYNNGMKPQDITIKLGFKYNQPVYNMLKKLGIFVPKEIEYKRKYELDEDFFEDINTVCFGPVENRQAAINQLTADLPLLQALYPT